ncbi:MAG: threonylcarbamoyl-AMP synthase [Nitrospinae bacterium]|nr:threonylcarbamoyl-AMP synthase [Nitrospinota bacterium]
MAELLKIDQSDPNNFHKCIDKSASIILSGGLVAFPTDTFYGLGVNAFDESAVKKVFQVKRRDPDKPLLVLIFDHSQLSRLIIEELPIATKLIKDFWPGPLTLLFRVADSVPKVLTGGSGKIGVRIPDKRLARELVKKVGLPVTAPSANISGGPNPLIARDVVVSIGDQIDIIIDDGERREGGKGSTIIDVSTSHPLVIREGRIPLKDIGDAIGVDLNLHL